MSKMHKGDRDLTEPSNYENEIAQAIVVLACAVGDVAKQLQMLGNGECDSQGWGAIEKMGKGVEDGLEKIADALDSGLARVTSQSDD